MHDILPDVTRWLENNEPVAIATVLQTWGSSPRRVGAHMAVNRSGVISGSVSGGCVESAVVQAALEVLERGQPQLLQFGVTDETAWQVGLACGGSLAVFVQRLDPSAFALLRAELESPRALAYATVIRGPRELLGAGLIFSGEKKLFGDLGAGLDDQVRAAALRALTERRSKIFDLSTAEESLEVFIDMLLPPPLLVIVGGVHIALALSSLGRTIGYRTVIVDPRRAFGNAARFPHVDQLIQEWPREAFLRFELSADSAVCSLTHDPKIDDPALQIALASRAFYVGALGSRTAQAKRRTRLLEAGVSEAQIARLHAPIGLDLGAQTPEEIALSIMAQVVAAYRARTPIADQTLPALSGAPP